MIIVNKNVKLRVGGRKAPALSVDEFVQILVDKLGVNPEVDDVFDKVGVEIVLYRVIVCRHGYHHVLCPTVSLRAIGGGAQV